MTAWCLALATAAAMAAEAGPSPAPADLVLRGGRVWPGKGLPGGTAIAVQGGRVLAVGDDAAIGALSGRGTRVVDLRGRLVVPGFDDAHVHVLDGGFALLSVDLRDARDEAELARRLGAYARTLPAGAWILNGNWDHEAWPSRALPTRRLVDPVTVDHPVFVSRLDGHMALANSLALRLAGIGRDTPDPEGGTIVRDAAGEPTGILKDNAQELVARVVPEPTREQTLGAARAALAEAARLGVTTLQDVSAADGLPAYQELRSRGELTARIYACPPIGRLADLRASGARTGLGDGWIRLGALKLFADGSMGAGTAAFFEPYADDPASRGLLLHPVEELTRLVREADGSGFDLAVHAIGDRANALVLDAFEQTVRANGARDRRFRIEHAQVVRREDLPRYRALGVIASIQPSHCIDDMRWAERRIGLPRCREAYNVRSFLAAGIPVAFGTDWPVESLDPRVGLYAAVTREFREGGPPGGWFPDERIGLEDALDLYTRGSAAAGRDEGDKGTLEAGKLADLVVLARDVVRASPKELLETPVDLTVVGGRVVFERGGAELRVP